MVCSPRVNGWFRSVCPVSCSGIGRPRLVMSVTEYVFEGVEFFVAESGPWSFVMRAGRAGELAEQRLRGQGAGEISAESTRRSLRRARS
jgi:hypothetical protein